MNNPSEKWWVFPGAPDHHSRYERGVLDGDTFDIIVDKGFRDFSRERFRLLGVDTAEIFGASRGTEEYERGIEHRDYVRMWMANAESLARDRDDWASEWPLLVRSRKETGAYGRWLAEIYGPDGNLLAADLQEAFGDEVLRG